MMLALVTAVTLFLPFAFANSNAARMILSHPGDVTTVKSIPRSSVTLTPSLPAA